MKTVFTTINILLIAAIAYLCVEMFQKIQIAKTDFRPDELSQQKTAKKADQQQTKQTVSKNQNKIIVTRNLFKVETEEKNEPPEKQETDDSELQKLEPTKLKVVLWGTVTGTDEVYAVIEDKKERRQALYLIGDTIQGAKVKKILRKQVVFTYQGKDQILEMETTSKNISKSRVPVKQIKPGAVPANGAIAKSLTQDQNAMMKQVKFRPHFTEGEPDGLMVYGIRPKSVFRKIGLRNGDIVKDINETPVVTAEDASGLFNEIDESEDGKITLFRRGKIKELFYQVKDDQYSVTDFPE